MKISHSPFAAARVGVGVGAALLTFVFAPALSAQIRVPDDNATTQAAVDTSRSGGRIRTYRSETRQTLSDVPLLGQYAISRAMGREQSSYHAAPSRAGLRMKNRPHGLAAAFGTAGAAIRSGTGRFALRLEAVGYGDSLEPVASVEPSAAKNRIEFRRDALTEWYVNGPLGLQHGFTLDRAPPRNGRGALTLSLRVDGDVALRVDEDAKGLTLETEPGAPRLRYAGLTAYDASGRTLEARLEAKGDQLHIRVDDAEARYPVVVDPLLEKAKLTASDGAARDRLGWSVSISGDTVVVGAPQSNQGNGKAYVFVKTGKGWVTTTETAKLTASDGAAGDRFGQSVSIRGHTVVVGANRDDDNGTDSGSAYVFVKTGKGWVTTTETAKLTASDGAAGDEFGYSVSISGDTVVVGARRDDDNGIDSGSAYVFVKPVTGWVTTTETAKLTASDGAAGDNLGFSVSINGDTVVGGAPYNSASGSAYVFVKPATGWSTITETAKLTASDGGWYLGWSVSINGDTVVIGAPDFARNGKAYVFVKTGTGWVTTTETAKLTASDGAANDQFGLSVSISGDTVVVGAPQSSANQGNGRAYVFVKPATGWVTTTETAKLTASDGAANDRFGWSLSISGDTVVVGANRDDDNGTDSGSAYVHSLASLTGSGSRRLGTLVNFSLTAIGDAGLPYQLASSFGTGPIPLGDRQIPLSPDSLFYGSIFQWFPLFNGYTGTLDRNDNASATLLIPNISALIGTQIHSAFVTVGSGVESVSDLFSFRIQA